MSPRLASAMTSSPCSRGVVHDLAQRCPPGRAQALEARDLGLDRDALLAGGVEHQPAMRRDGSRGPLGGTGRVPDPPAAATSSASRPEPRRIGI